MSLGKTIVRLRMQKQWKQKDLAEKLGLHVRNLVRWENDQARPRQTALQQLADVLGVSPEELEHGNPTAPQTRDPEIAELFEQFLELDPVQRDAVKIVLRDLLALRRLEKTFERRAAS